MCKYAVDAILDVVAEQLEPLTLEEHSISRRYVGEATYSILRRLWDLGYKEVSSQWLYRTLSLMYSVRPGMVWNSKRNTTVLVGYKLKQLVP